MIENVFLKYLGAKWICQQMGIDEDDFYEGISSIMLF